MVKSCCAYNCSERSVKNSAYSFHRFPKEEDKRKKWEIALRRANFKATAFSFLCSKHFPKECFYTTKKGKRYLKDDAIPTLFDFPKPFKLSQTFGDSKTHSEMEHHCCVKGCKTVFVKGGADTFHKFPKDEVYRKMWVAQMKTENFIVQDSTELCSKHFREECFDRSKLGGTWLKKDAIPTIFNLCNCPKKTLVKDSIPQVTVDTVPSRSNVSSDQNQVQVETILPSLNIPSFQNPATVDTVPSSSSNVSSDQSQVQVETILPSLNIPSFQNPVTVDTVPSSSYVSSDQNQVKVETILPSLNIPSFQNPVIVDTVSPSSSDVLSVQNQVKVETILPNSNFLSFQNQEVKVEEVSLSESEESPLEEQTIVAPVSQNLGDAVIKGEKRKYYLGDYDENDMNSPSKAKRVFLLAKARDEINKKEIRKLRRRNMLMARKIKSLKKILKDLMSKKLKEVRKTSKKDRDRTSQSIEDIAEEIKMIINYPSPTTSDCEEDSFRFWPDKKAQRSTASSCSSSASTSDKHKALEEEIETEGGQTQWQPVGCSNEGSFRK